METFSLKSCFRFAWDTFKARPWFFVGFSAILFAVSVVIDQFNKLLQNGVEQAHLAVLPIVLFLISLALNTLYGMGINAFMLAAHDDVKAASYKSLWHPGSFWSYFATSIVVGFVSIVGLVFLVVPGVWVILTTFFFQYLIIERKLSPKEAIKESARITKGHKLDLLGLLLLLILVNILGVIALVVGLLVSIPVSLLAVVHAYRTIAKDAPEPVVPPAPELPPVQTTVIA